MIFRSSAIFILLLTAACGRFDFGSRLNQQSKVPEAVFLTIDGKSAGLGSCSPITVNAWAKDTIPGAPRKDVALSISGLRGSDSVFTDNQCRNAGSASAMTLPANSTSLVFYLKAGSAGSISLGVVGGTFSAVAAAVKVELVPAKFSFLALTSLTIDAGFCSAPISFEIQDATGAGITAVSQDIHIAGGENIVFSDANCTSPIPSAKFNLRNARTGQFYMRRNSAVGSAVAVILKDPNRDYFGTDSISVAFRSVPYQVRITGGPSTLNLGVCEANDYQIELRDVDNNLVGPLAGSVTIELGSPNGVINYRPNCSSMTAPVSNLVFTAGQSVKNIFLESRTRSSVTARVYSLTSSINEHQINLGVQTVPVYLDLQGPSSIVAGTTTSAYTVTVQDGLNVALNAPSATTVTLSGSLLIRGTFCAQTPCTVGTGLPGNQISIPMGSQSASFYFLADANRPTESGLALTVSASGLQPFTKSLISIGERVPAALRITSSVTTMDLGFCGGPFTITLLDDQGVAVDPPSGGSYSVNVNTAGGSGFYRTSCTSSSNITAIAFASGEVSKQVYFVPTSDPASTPQVGLRAERNGLTTATYTVSVTAAPYKVGITGPTSVTAGVPAGPFTVQLQDYLSAAINASNAVAADIDLPAGARALYCSAAACASTVATASVTIQAGMSVSEPFYILSDVNSNGTHALSADVGNPLQDASKNLSFVRTSLTADPGFGVSGKVLSNIAGYTGGEILASRYDSAGKLTVAGYLVQGGLKRLAFGRYKASRAQGMGEFDTAFAGTGVRVLNLGEEAWATAMIPDGTPQANHLICGVQRTAAGHDVVLLRVKSDGSVDTAFRHSGGVPDPIALPGDQFANAIALGTDGTIYVVGSTNATTQVGNDVSDVLVLAFQTNGTMVAGGGVAQFDFSASDDVGKAVVVQNSLGTDRLFIGGTTATGNRDILFAKVYGTRGDATTPLTLDIGYGTGGFGVFDWGANGDSLESLFVMPTGRVIAVGSKDGSGSNEIVLMGLNSGGALDSSFGSSNGYTFLNVSGASNELGYAVGRPSQGGLYLAGTAEDDVFVARYNDDGRSDGLSPQSAKYTVTGAPLEAGRSIVFGQDSKPLVSGTADGTWGTYQLLR